MGIRFTKGLGIWTDDGSGKWVFTIEGTIPMKINQANNQIELDAGVTDDAF